MRGHEPVMQFAPDQSPPPPAPIALVGKPCRAHNVLAGRIVTDPSSGREMLALTDMNEETGAELILIDIGNGRGKAYRAPAGSGSWALLPVARDRLIIGTFYDGRFLVFDLRKRRFTDVAAFPGESYIWNLAEGSDGRIYGGTYPGGKLGALDLDRLQVTDCGAPAPPNLYLRYVSRLPDGRILCGFGSEQPRTLIYDPASRTFFPVPEQLLGITRGCTWNGFFLSGAAVFEGTALRRVDPPPFPSPPGPRSWSVEPNLTSERTLWLVQGPKLYWFRAGMQGLRAFAEVSVPGGRLLAASESGVVAGIRGQEYFIVREGGTPLLRRIPSSPGPRPTLFLRIDPAGRLWGGPHFGQTLFFYDPTSRRTVNTATVSDNGGEVYDVAFRGRTVYAAAYSGGEIIRYDPDQPWDQMGHTNPRTIAEVGSRGYIRPTGGITLGSNGFLYVGWMAGYGTYGGAISVTDANTGSTKLFENPLGSQAVASLLVRERTAFVGTSLSANGLPDKKGEWARFGVMDLSSGAVSHMEELEGISSVRVLGMPQTGDRVILAAGGRISTARAPDWRVDRSALSDVPPVTSNGTGVLAGSGRSWLVYGSGNNVVALEMETGRTYVLASLPRKVTNVAVPPAELSGRSSLHACTLAYVSCGAEIYRVKATREWSTELGLGGRPK